MDYFSFWKLMQVSIWARFIGKTVSKSLMMSNAYFLACLFKSSFTLHSPIAFRIIDKGNETPSLLETHIPTMIWATSFLMFSSYPSRSVSETWNSPLLRISMRISCFVILFPNTLRSLPEALMPWVAFVKIWSIYMTSSMFDSCLFLQFVTLFL